MIAWFTAAVLVLIAELFTGTVYLLVVSAALFGAGISAWLFPNTAAAVMTAAVLAAVGVWWAHGWLKQRRRPSAEESARNDLDIGQTVQVLRHLHGNLYEVHYRGTLWQAQAENAIHSEPAPQTAAITGKNGNFLLIRFG